MAKCSICGKQAKTKVKDLLLGISKCEECLELENATEFSEENATAEIEDIINSVDIESNVDDLPFELKKEIADKVKSGDLDPDNTKIIALDMSEMEGSMSEMISKLLDENPDFDKKMRLTFAQAEFSKATKAIIACLHSLAHIGIPPTELNRMINMWSELQWLLINEYLFIGQTRGVVDKVELHSLNVDAIFNCGEDSEEDTDA